MRKFSVLLLHQSDRTIHRGIERKMQYITISRRMHNRRYTFPQKLFATTRGNLQPFANQPDSVLGGVRIVIRTSSQS